MQCAGQQFDATGLNTILFPNRAGQMLRIFLVTAACLATTAAALDVDVADALQAQLQAIIDAKGPYWNVVSCRMLFPTGD